MKQKVVFTLNTSFTLSPFPFTFRIKLKKKLTHKNNYLKQTNGSNNNGKNPSNLSESEES